MALLIPKTIIFETNARDYNIALHSAKFVMIPCYCMLDAERVIP
jgi:hypothetical protein